MRAARQAVREAERRSPLGDQDFSFIRRVGVRLDKIICTVENLTPLV
jgi:hypothetical protein